MEAAKSSSCFASAKVESLPPPDRRSADPPLITAGDIHIWDRDTAALLRYIRPPTDVPELRDMTCVGWNSGLEEAMMFATGSHDGTVRVWSTAMVKGNDEDESSTDVASDE